MLFYIAAHELNAEFHVRGELVENAQKRIVKFDWIEHVKFRALSFWRPAALKISEEFVNNPAYKTCSGPSLPEHAKHFIL